MFIKEDPITINMVQIMDEQGTITNPKLMQEFDQTILTEALKRMIFARLVDLQIVSYQRQGRIQTYPPNLGQEAIAVATGMVLGDNDWLVPAYREMAAWLAKGMSLLDIFKYWGGDEQGSAISRDKHILPISIPIASQLPHAVGLGYALKYKKQKNAVIAFCGDGGTSEGDFHEALNFASVWHVPVVFIIQNNGYAISCPFTKQTGSKNIALKSIAYGIKGIQVDGNDFCATYTTIKQALELARQGKGPILIEALTYRLGAHTTSDDPSRYRTSGEEQEWQKKDPIKRIKNYLTSKDLWDESQEKKLEELYRKKVETEFSKFENLSPYQLEDCFAYLYKDIPPDLHEQKVLYQRFQHWKEAQK